MDKRIISERRCLEIEGEFAQLQVKYYRMKYFLGQIAEWYEPRISDPRTEAHQYLLSLGEEPPDRGKQMGLL